MVFINGFHRASAVVRYASCAACIAALTVAAGCSHNKSDAAARAAAAQKQQAEAQARQAQADAEFAAGANKPPNADTLYALSKILATQGHEAESMSVLNNLIAQYPNYLPAYNALAETHLRAGRNDEAMATLTAGLKRAPSDAVLLNNMGMVLFLQERYAEALPYFDRAAAARPDEPMYRANRAASLGMMGRSNEANSIYRQFLDPVKADKNVEILNRARKKAEKDRIEDARASGLLAPAAMTIPAPRSTPRAVPATQPAEAMRQDNRD